MGDEGGYNLYMKKIVFSIGDEAYAFFTNISRYADGNGIPVVSLYNNIMLEINAYCKERQIDGKIACPVLVEEVNEVWTVTFPKPDYRI